MFTRLFTKSARSFNTIIAKSIVIAIASISYTAISSASSLSVQEKERQIYIKAKKAFKHKDQKYYEQLKAQLTHYPLYPYLEYKELTQKISQQQAGIETSVRQYLDTYADTYLSHRLRLLWLKKLASQKNWRAYSRDYRDGLRSTVVDCFYLTAQLMDKKALPVEHAKKLWLSGKSRPNECNPGFLALEKQGHITSRLLWQRHHLSINQRNLKLASYLRKKMPLSVKKLAILYEQVHQNPSILATITEQYSDKEKMADIIYYGLHRHAHSQPEETAVLLEKFESIYLLDDERFTILKNRIAVKLINADKPEMAGKIIEKISPEQREPATTHLLRYYLKHLQWDRVNHWINQLPKEVAQNDRWRYWQARALEILAPVQNVQQQAKSYSALYEEISENRSFYGFLAADKLNKNYYFQDYPAPVQIQVMNQVRANPSLQRAQELFQLEEMHLARMEWSYGIKGFNEEQFIAAGQLSHLWGWHRKAIEVMAKAKYWDDLSIRFPIAYEQHISQQAKERDIPSSLILAIARQESAWEFDARSRVGARGLMQIMPATAKATAKKSGIRYSRKKLFQPTYNIILGSHYISGLLERYENNRPLAIAAYNAGPSRVKRWLERSQAQLPTDVWIEIIPFKETRKYVQNVLSYEVIYNYRRGKDQQLLTLAEAGTSL